MIMSRHAQKVRMTVKPVKTKQTQALKSTTATTAKTVQETSSTQDVNQKQSQELAQTLVYSSVISVLPKY